MEYDWTQPTAQGRRTAWEMYTQAAAHNVDTMREIDRSFLRAALCGTELTPDEYRTIDHRSGDEWRSLLNLGEILRKVYARGLEDGKAAARADS